MTTRCKFQCNTVTKRKGHKSPFVYEAEFSAVTGGSPDNDKFFEYTPTGVLKVGIYKEDVFEVGAFYFLDITKVEPAAP